MEARNWLTTNKNPSALASNRFDSTKAALEYVDKLHELGSPEVLIDNVRDEEWRIKEEGGPYADSLIVKLPVEKDKRSKLFEIVNKEAKEQGFDPYEDSEQDTLLLWWD